MPTIKVNTSRLSQYESEMQDILSRVNSITNQFNSLSRNLDWDIKAESNINSRLSGISRELSAELSGIIRMKHYLGTARAKYVAVESRNSGKKLKNEVSDIGIKNNYYDEVTNKTSPITIGPAGPSLSTLDPSMTMYTGDEKKSVFGTVAKGSVLSGAINENIGFFGYEGEVAAEGNVLGGEIKTSSSGAWDYEKGEIGAEAKVSADGYLANGKLSADLGLLSSTASATVGAVGASGKIGATLFSDGILAPSVGLEGKASASVAKGELETRFGTEDNNFHAKASGQVLTAEASAQVKAGKIQYEDSRGNTKTEVGIKAEIGAEAYVAKGCLSEGFTVLGIDVDVSVEGKIGGVGATAGGYLTSSSASGEIGLGLNAGLGVKVDVDWSDFTLFKK